MKPGAAATASSGVAGVVGDVGGEAELGALAPSPGGAPRGSRGWRSGGGGGAPWARGRDRAGRPGRARRPAGGRGGRARLRDAGGRSPSPAAAILTRAMPTPLTKGSQPMSPTSGCAAAWCTRCSPPPKPTSSQSGRPSAKIGASGVAPRVLLGRHALDPEPRQQLVEHPPLRRLQLLAVPASVEVAARPGRAGFAPAHGPAVRPPWPAPRSGRSAPRRSRPRCPGRGRSGRRPRCAGRSAG